MKHLLLSLTVFACTCVPALCQSSLTSPDGTLRLSYTEGTPLNVVLYAGDRELARIDDIHLRYGEARYPTVNAKTSRPTTVQREIRPVVATKRDRITEHYREVTLNYPDDTGVELRLYNDGLAYRLTELPDGRLTHENFALRMDPETELFFPKEERFYSHNERIYARGKPEDFVDSLASLPLLAVLPSGYHVFVSESNLADFPGLWVYGTPNGIRGTHPGLPTGLSDTNDRTETFDRQAYSAVTETGQATPWRILGVSEDAAGLLDNQLTYLLAEPSRGDFSWVRPGQVAWDWYNANNIYGVDFEAGLNTETYKHYIDFAAEYGIPYIILDEGWSPTEDVLTPVADIDIEELVAYGDERDVDLILWTLWKPFYENLDAATAKYEDWGIAGVKVDFMQRDDQEMVRMYREMAEAAAEHKMLLDFHGSYKPAGLHRTFPNVITREGLKGLEWYKFGNPESGVGPEHDVTLPFIRMVAGPMDFTPGAMRNAMPENHHYVFDRPVSLGTRAHQLAMYVVYESPLQMLADAPTHYRREPEVTEFITSVPTVWVETVPLAGVVGDYVAVARRAAGGDWYLGALNDLTPRELTLSLDFLPAGDYELEVFRDGPNHERYAEDYTREKLAVAAGQELTVPLGRGGGWVGRFRRRR
jgi:alpha-glucosidase